MTAHGAKQVKPNFHEFNRLEGFARQHRAIARQSRHARLFPVSAASKPFRCVSIAIPIEKQRLKTGG